MKHHSLRVKIKANTWLTFIIKWVSAYLDKTIEIRKECGADGWVEKYERELAAIS